MVSPLAIIAVRLDVSSFVEGDTTTLFYFPQRPKRLSEKNDCINSR